MQFADIGNNNNLESCIGSQPININKLERHIANITIYWLRSIFLVNAAVWGEKNTNVQQSHARQFWGAKSPPTRGLLPDQSSFGPFLKCHPPFGAQWWPHCIVGCFGPVLGKKMPLLHPDPTWPIISIKKAILLYWQVNINCNIGCANIIIYWQYWYWLISMSILIPHLPPPKVPKRCMLLRLPLGHQPGPYPGSRLACRYLAGSPGPYRC